MSDDVPKYLIFKYDEFMKYAVGVRMSDLPESIADGVVIRRQDSFAPPALDAYANSIQVALSLVSDTTDPRMQHLQEIADYFHEQAHISWNSYRRLPD